MKPWEETWAYQAIRCRIVVEEPGGNYFAIMDLDHDAQHQPPAVADARGRLAAAAPEMARLLLKLEIVGDGGPGFCPACGVWRPDYPHKDDCEWVAVLRKAGVIADKEREA